MNTNALQKKEKLDQFSYKLKKYILVSDVHFWISQYWTLVKMKKTFLLLINIHIYMEYYLMCLKYKSLLEYSLDFKK